MSRVYVAERSIVASFIAGALSLDEIVEYAFDAREIVDERLRLLFVATRALRELGKPLGGLERPHQFLLEVAKVLARGHIPGLEREAEELHREGALELEELRARKELGARCDFAEDCGGEATVVDGLCTLC